MVGSDRLFGLVVCGGKSTRMGLDKSQLTYHGKPQSDYVYDMMSPFCEEVFLSCNRNQPWCTESRRKVIVDLPEYENIGPMAALLSAFYHWPKHNWLVVGCDYPFMSGPVLEQFLKNIKTGTPATAFYNTANRYEPLLAYYESACGPLLTACFEKGAYALQSFLRDINAGKYYAEDEQVHRNVNTWEEYWQVRMFMEKQN
jgi:molybdopterin-guanine dinucleotide biosynthesis protein A